MLSNILSVSRCPRTATGTKQRINGGFTPRANYSSLVSDATANSGRSRTALVTSFKVLASITVIGVLHINITNCMTAVWQPGIEHGGQYSL